ncbi:MAG: hypothetical protein GY851_08840 [bacterium]|nr:hypothetical protein [bacterium]
MGDSRWKFGAYALGLSLGGLVLAVLIGVGARLFGYQVDVPAYLLFLGCQIGAFVLGMGSRREALGKAASIMSAVLALTSMMTIA